MRPFWQQAFLNAVGPVMTALLVGVLASWISRRAQRRREDEQLRRRLVDQLTAAASRFYIALQDYQRAEKATTDAKKTERLRHALDSQYRRSRVEGAVLERRLAAYFRDRNPRALWHAISDVLTYRYFQLTNQATDEVVRDNTGQKHSRLTEAEIEDWETTAREHQLRLLDELTSSVLVAQPRRRGLQQQG
jgi:hypothetical protein